MALTRMIFAVQMTDAKPTRLCVKGDVGTPPPEMTSLRRKDSKSSSVGCVDGSWTMDLDAGDYLIEIQVEDWLAGRLDITAKLAPGQSPPTFVCHEPSSVGLAAWTATSLYVDPPQSSTVNDSKDPWPPPPPPRVKLAPESEEWFTATLTAARTRIKSQPVTNKYPPEAVLDALVTGR